VGIVASRGKERKRGNLKGTVWEASRIRNGPRGNSGKFRERISPSVAKSLHFEHRNEVERKKRSNPGNREERAVGRSISWGEKKKRQG